jgi:NAD(P)-dependent dehydrogenase (short-subunit alcohol dehydrogenase family)
MSEFSEKVVLITGAGSGIGKATAELFAARGARVACFDLKAEKVQQLASSIEADGGEALALVGDVSKLEAVADAVGAIDERWGRLDIVFANAGINGVWAPLEELKVEEFDHTLAVNLRGAFLTIQQSAPLLRRQGGAVIITSSVNGTRIFSGPGITAYAASKAAQLAMGKILARELAADCIRVNVICPGSVKTDIGQSTVQRHTERISPPVKYPQGQMPLTHGRAAEPGQVAQLVLFLASDEAEMITGTEMWIDGAESLIRG